MTRVLPAILLLPLLVVSDCCGADAASGAEPRRPNVLFIAVDDLRPQLGCYGATQMKTPHIDRLAARGTLFKRAYCMVPTCGASRASLMTGIRPTPRRFTGYRASAQKEAPGITTLNTHFKSHGYTTISNGKVFHLPEDNAIGWSRPAWRPKNVGWYHIAENQALHESRSGGNRQGRPLGPAWEAPEVSDDDTMDGKILKKSLDDLRTLADADRPFFLAVGFYKPHLPFVAPKKYWDLYDADEIRLPETYHRPKDAPSQSLHNSGELRAYAGIPKSGPLSDEQARSMIHGYYACVSFADALIGRLLDELDRLELTDNTAVVLWGDHGWNLGEHLLWCKHSCYETSMHAPLIIAAPGFPAGGRTDGLAEFIDIYPSLCEIAGLPAPKHLQGRSFVSQLKDPASPGKPAAIGRYGRGDTIRTDQFRYSLYSAPRVSQQPQMLYDHRTDPQEDTNIASQPESRDDVSRLRELLKNPQKATAAPVP